MDTREVVQAVEIILKEKKVDSSRTTFKHLNS